MLELAVALLVLIAFPSPAFPGTTSSKALRFTVAKRTSTSVIVQRGSVRLTLSRGDAWVQVRDVRRYRVLRRARDFCLLMPLISVTSRGAVGNGESDDAAAIAETVHAAARAAKGVYVPPGMYRINSRLVVPDGLAVYGAGMARSWLQGQVVFGSASSFTDLKIGPSSAGLAGLKNSDGARGTTFTRCHFRGGGATSDNDNSSTVNLGDGYDLSDLTFKDCEFERSLGTSWSGRSDIVHRDNVVSIYASRNTVDTVTFDGCHLGVSNGVASGAQRMMVEVWAGHGVDNLYKNITFRGCDIEPSNAQGLDFSCYADSGQGDGVLIEGCTLYGAGVDPKGTAWGQGITLEWPKNVTIRNNTFYRCSEGAIYPNHYGFSYDSNLTVTGNTFDFDTAYGGITADSSTGMCVTQGANGTITGNTFIWHGASDLLGCVWFAGANSTGNTVTGNVFKLSQTQLAITAVNGARAAGNIIKRNTVVRQ